MDCRECSNDLSAYIDGELAESAAAHMREHLLRCPPCQEQYDDLVKSVSFVVDHTDVLEPVPEIWNNLRARIAEMPPPAESGVMSRFLTMTRWPAMIATLAATLILAVGMWGYYQHEQSQRELESYMNEYIQMRTAQENLNIQRINQTQDEAGAGLILENPFADIRPAVFTNPFRGGDK